MKKAELVEAVATAAGLTKADATRAIDATFATITEALAKGDKVPLVGFGTFAVSKEQHVKGVIHKLVKQLKLLLETLLHLKQVQH